MAAPWDAWCAEYLAARDAVSSENIDAWDAVEQRLIGEFAGLGELAAGEIAWLAAALADERRKWFAVFACVNLPELPETLFAPLLEAGIEEPNPSFNRDFIYQAARAGSPARAIGDLLAALETGANPRKAGAVKALYWAWRTDAGAPDAAAELALRQRCLLLREFVANQDVGVRRCVIPALNLDPERYPAELRPLVAEAVAIARSHPDDYIRHRVEVQLGNESRFRALPSGD